MEAGQYAVPFAGRDGELRKRGRESKYYYRCMGRDNLFRPCYGIHLSPPGAVLLRDNPGDRRVCYQSDYSQFVAGLLEDCGAVELPKPPTLVRPADFCGVKSGRDTDKFSLLHLTPEKAGKLSHAPVIKESPVNIECRVTEIRELGSHHMFLAEVLAVDADEAYLNPNGKFELNRTGLLAYSHGSYFTLGEQCGSFGYSVKKKRKRS